MDQLNYSNYLLDVAEGAEPEPDCVYSGAQEMFERDLAFVQVAATPLLCPSRFFLSEYVRERVSAELIIKVVSHLLQCDKCAHTFVEMSERWRAEVDPIFLQTFQPFSPSSS